MTRQRSRLRRFRFNRPQRIAALLLALFLVQGFWLIERRPITESDYQYARCGREMWEGRSPLAGYFTSCGNIHDGILAYRIAGLPLTLNLLVERGLDRFRKPEDRILQTDAAPGAWELRHQLRNVLLLLRLPFLFAGFLLGGALWWVTRRLFGNAGGYTALALYCFSPAILAASTEPGPEILAALGVFGGVYTCIGVAHAMQGPRRKWRPRIVLLAAAFGLAAAAHIAALLLTVVLGLAFMLWIAEGRRAHVLPAIVLAVAGAFVFLFACYGFSPDAFGYIFRSGSALLWVSLDPPRRFFSDIGNAGLSLAFAASILLFLGLRKARYFGNVAPLLSALLILPLVLTGSPGAPWLWALPFLLPFIAGLFADAYEEPRGRTAMAAGAVLAVLQASVCLLRLSGRL